MITFQEKFSNLVITIYLFFLNCETLLLFKSIFFKTLKLGVFVLLDTESNFKCQKSPTVKLGPPSEETKEKLSAL